MEFLPHLGISFMVDLESGPTRYPMETEWYKTLHVLIPEWGMRPENHSVARKSLAA